MDDGSHPIAIWITDGRAATSTYAGCCRSERNCQTSATSNTSWVTHESRTPERVDVQERIGGSVVTVRSRI